MLLINILGHTITTRHPDLLSLIPRYKEIMCLPDCIVCPNVTLSISKTILFLAYLNVVMASCENKRFKEQLLKTVGFIITGWAKKKQAKLKIWFKKNFSIFFSRFFLSWCRPYWATLVQRWAQTDAPISCDTQECEAWSKSHSTVARFYGFIVCSDKVLIKNSLYWIDCAINESE